MRKIRNIIIDIYLELLFWKEEAAGLWEDFTSGFRLFVIICLFLSVSLFFGWILSDIAFSVDKADYTLCNGSIVMAENSTLKR